MSVYEKLFQIQQSLKAPKGKYNSFGKYRFRSCEDILEAVKPLLKQQKLIVLLSDEVQMIEQRYYIKANACVVDIETSEKVQCSAFAREDENKKGMDLSQITGTSSSYARKYALNGLFCIDGCDDSDATNTQAKNGTNNNQNQQEQNKKYYCDICGKQFIGCYTSTGKKLTAEQEYQVKKQKFGQALCPECMKKRGKT